jgi:hypothetical protein
VVRVFLVGPVVVLAVLVVVFTFGSLFQLTRLKVQSFWLFAGGLGIQIALEFVDLPAHQIDTVGFGLLMTSYVLLLTFCLVNLTTRGFGVIAAGIAMNTLVIGLNRGMPTISVAEDAHGAPIEHTVKHRPERSGDLLTVLDDRILSPKLPKPFGRGLVSFGDLVMGVGICELAYFSSRRRYTRDGLVTQESEMATPRRRKARSSAPSTRPS